MRVESLFLLGVGVFFGIIGIIYWFTSYEDGGTMMLLGTCALGLLPGGYYFFWHRRMGNSRPEDREDATVEEGAGVVSAFPSSSIWPFVLGMGAFLVVLALVWGIWLLVLGVLVMVVALTGVTAESRRGGRV
ncbi:MAG TPA: cytochrome c oxidase subunit 4 [Acidimicrobiales bacterium]|nr:cytochrome c oxidase subunit 4 [Acidimicrobiales bacterium]